MPLATPVSPSLQRQHPNPAPVAAAAPEAAAVAAPEAAAAVEPSAQVKFLRSWAKDRQGDKNDSRDGRGYHEVHEHRPESRDTVHRFDPPSPGVVQLSSPFHGQPDLNAVFGPPPPLPNPETVRAARARRDAAPAPAAPAAPAPAPTPVSPGVALLRREMADVKGQPHLMKTLEKMVNAAERQPDGDLRKSNRDMVFGGPPGTGKTSSVQKIAKVLAEVGVLKHDKVIVLNKTTKLPPGTVPVAIGKKFEDAKGGILFLDEVHSRSDSKAFVDALVPLLSEFEGTVMVIIAGYLDKVMDWLRTKDPGLPRRFPQNYRLEFLPSSGKC